MLSYTVACSAKVRRVELMKPNTLYYHPNEARGGIPKLLPQAESLAELSVDYGWVSPELVLVEHKEIGDLAHSLRNGHLVAQLERAKEQTPYVYLMVTGYDHQIEDGRGQWTYLTFCDALFSALYGLQVSGPIYASSKSKTAENIQGLFRQTRRLVLGKGRPVVPKWRHTKGYDQVESYVRALPSIGWTRAEALANRAPTWQYLVHILTKDGPKALHAVPGIGPILAKRIYSLVIDGAS